MLYQLAVQSPGEDVRFLARIYRGMRGKEARHLREDFCGTALLCASWVRGRKPRTAEGFDICTRTLAWGRTHNLARLGERDPSRREVLALELRRRGRELAAARRLGSLAAAEIIAHIGARPEAKLAALANSHGL